MSHADYVQGIRSPCIMNGPFVVRISQVSAGIVALQDQCIMLCANSCKDMEIRYRNVAACLAIYERIVTRAARKPIVPATTVENVIAARPDDTIRQRVADTGQSPLHQC